MRPLHEEKAWRMGYGLAPASTQIVPTPSEQPILIKQDIPGHIVSLLTWQCSALIVGQQINRGAHDGSFDSSRRDGGERRTDSRLRICTERPEAPLGTPRSVISDPPREFGPGGAPSISPDPDVLRIDPGFNNLLIGQEVIHRVATGFHLAEGPAWSSEGQYAIFSDVKNDTLYRYIWETAKSPPSASRPSIPTATVSTIRAARSPARISSAAWSAGRSTAR